jgi:hypothetical protein
MHLSYFNQVKFSANIWENWKEYLLVQNHGIVSPQCPWEIDDKSARRHQKSMDAQISYEMAWYYHNL